MRFIIAALLVLVLATSAAAFETKAFQMREDFGTEPLYTCYMNYYYYIPCPTYSWFWMYTNWSYGDIIGQYFRIGDASMYRTDTSCPPADVSCNRCEDQVIEQFRVLDFAGYGTIYPGLFTVEFNIYCSDFVGCPVGPSLWNSGPVEFCVGGWNYVDVNPDLCVSACHAVPFTWCEPMFVITAQMIGQTPVYPAWGMDNISTPVSFNCAMHDFGCCPALYPRPAQSHYPTRIHSGYYGNGGFQYCPPLWFLDGRDSTGDVYGFIELAWRVYLITTGPTAVEPSTWGSIKAMYK